MLTTEFEVEEIPTLNNTDNIQDQYYTDPEGLDVEEILDCYKDLDNHLNSLKKSHKELKIKYNTVLILLIVVSWSCFIPLVFLSLGIDNT